MDSGWNTVYLTVQPVPADCESVFNGLPVERVAQWSRTSGGVEFISDAAEDLPRASHWMVWRPQTDDGTVVDDFSNLQAGGAYLVKMSAAATLQLKGRAVLVHPRWIPNEMTLTGLPVGPGVSFAGYFSHTGDIGVDSNDGGAIYEIRADGSELQIYRPSVAQIQPLNAYWIKTGQILSYDGPLEVTFSEGGNLLDFGSRLLPRQVRLKNVTDQARTVTLELLDSETPPLINGQSIDLLQGPVPLSVLLYNADTKRDEFVPMPAIMTTNVAPNSTVELSLMPRAKEMQSVEQQAVWASLLRISDGEVVQVAGIRCLQEEAAFADPTGLWIGSVAVDAVNRAPSREGATNAWDTVTPVPVSRPYTFRLLIHVAADGECRLLQRAMPAWLPAVEGGDPQSYIFTDAEYAAQFKTDHPEGRVVRLSSATLPLIDPELMTGSFGGSDTLECTVSLAHNDAVNPFVHPFHPDHDNREIRNGVAFPLGEGEEAFEVTRAFRLTFAEDDPRGANPKWQISENGGVFEETVEGLNKTIHVKGAFRVQKVSDCGVLSYLAQ